MSDAARCAIPSTCIIVLVPTGAASALLENLVVEPVLPVAATRHVSIPRALVLSTVATHVRNASTSLQEATTGSHSSTSVMLRGQEWKSDCDKEDWE